LRDNRLLKQLKQFALCVCLLVAPTLTLAQTTPNAGVMVTILSLLLDDSGGSGALRAHWKLDETSGQDAEDSSSYAHHASVLCHEVSPCLPDWVPGQKDGALHFNGVSDYVSLPYQSLHNRGDMTLSLWFKTAIGDHSQTLISGAEQFNSNSSRIKLSSSNKIYYYTGERSWDYEYWTVAPYADDAWHQLTIVRNDTLNQVTLYLDGVSFGVKYTGLDRIDVEPGPYRRAGTGFCRWTI